MRAFLSRTLAFLSLAAAAYAVLLATVFFLNRAAIESCRVGAGVGSVIVGDSHPAWAIDDADISGLRNISLNAEGYKYTYAKLRRLLRSEPEINRVYLGFSYHNISSYFDEYVTGPTFRFFVDRYLSVMSFSDLAELVTNSPRNAPDLLRRIMRDGLSAGLSRSCPLYGRFSDEPMTNTFDAAAMERRIAEQYYVEGQLRGVSESNLEYLDRIVELCRQEDVELVLLNTPLHPKYEERVPQEFRDRYSRILEKYALEHFDFGDLKLTDAEFLPDGDHTNYRGALLTSSRFAEYHRTRLVHSGE